MRLVALIRFFQNTSFYLAGQPLLPRITTATPQSKAESIFSRPRLKSTSQLETQFSGCSKLLSVWLVAKTVFTWSYILTTCKIMSNRKTFELVRAVRVVSTKVIAWRLKLVQASWAEVIAIKQPYTVTVSKVCEDISPAWLLDVEVPSSITFEPSGFF